MQGLRRFTVYALVSAVLLVTGPAAGTSAAETINMRPISDWLTGRVPTGNWTSPFDRLPEGYFAVTYVGPLASGVVGATEIVGTIVERRLESGRVEVTVRVVGNNAPLTIYGMQDWQDWLNRGRTPPLPTAVLGEGTNGSLDFRAELVFLVDTMGAPYPRPIPAADFLKSTIVASGWGTFTSYAASFGYTPGAIGGVQILQTGLFAIAENANGAALEDAFPGELVNLSETGR
jgi:hypothetical protein